MLVYVAGPYAAPTVLEIAANVARAIEVCRVHAEADFTVISPHAHGWGGVYGTIIDDGSAAPSRARALANGLALAVLVAVNGGKLVAISRDDGTLSPGTQAEVDAYTAAGGTDLQIGTFDALRHGPVA